MSSASSSIRCKIVIKPAPGLATFFRQIPALLAVLVFVAGQDLMLAVLALLGATRAMREIDARLMLASPRHVRKFSFSESRGWQLELVGGERVLAQLVGEPRAFRQFCALEFLDDTGGRYPVLACSFNTSDDDLRALNMLMHWSTQAELFAARIP